MSTHNREQDRAVIAVETAVRLSTTRGKVLAQLLFCEGCCCGRTDRGYPSFPKDWIKSVWKERKLNRHIQLTISGCLGPCDVANVACLIRSDGDITWLGRLGELSEYEAFVEWAVNCQQAGHLLPLPPEFAAKEFDRFTDSSSL